MLILTVVYIILGQPSYINIPSEGRTTEGRGGQIMGKFFPLLFAGVLYQESHKKKVEPKIWIFFLLFLTVNFSPTEFEYKKFQ